jgi:tetratricopeptide (TPR) repeat protein
LRIICNYCLTEHEVEPPAAAAIEPGFRIRFACMTCGQNVQGPETTPEVSQAREPTPSGRQAPVDEPAVTLTSEPPTSKPPPSKAAPEPAVSMLVKQDGRVYRVGDQATLQRWVVEQRMTRSDLVSEDGLSWSPVAELPGVAAFFEVVDRLETLERTVAQGVVAPPAPQDTPPGKNHGKTAPPTPLPGQPEIGIPPLDAPPLPIMSPEDWLNGTDEDDDLEPEHAAALAEATPEAPVLTLGFGAPQTVAKDNEPLAQPPSLDLPPDLAQPPGLDLPLLAPDGMGLGLAKHLAPVESAGPSLTTATVDVGAGFRESALPPKLVEPEAPNPLDHSLDAQVFDEVDAPAPVQVQVQVEDDGEPDPTAVPSLAALQQALDHDDKPKPLVMEVEWPEEEDLPTERQSSRSMLSVDFENEPELGGVADALDPERFGASAEEGQDGVKEVPLPRDLKGLYGAEDIDVSRPVDTDLLFPEEVEKRMQRNDLLRQALGEEDEEDEDYEDYEDYEEDLAWTEDRTIRNQRLVALFFFLLALGVLGWKLANPDSPKPAPATATAPTPPPAVEASAVADAETAVSPPTAEEVPPEPKPQPAKTETAPTPKAETEPKAEPEPKPEPKPEPEPEPEPKVTPPTTSSAASPWGTSTSTATTSTAKEPTPKPKPLPDDNGKSSRVYAEAGWSSLGAKNYSKARSDFIEAVAISPSDADAHYGLAYAAQKQGDVATSVRHYCKALKHGSGDRDLQLEVKSLLDQLGAACE